MGDFYIVKYQQANSDVWLTSWFVYEGFFFDDNNNLIFINYEKPRYKNLVVNLVNPKLSQYAESKINDLKRAFLTEYDKEKEEGVILDPEADPEDQEYSDEILETD